jgi:hypothetical protein
MNVLFYAKNHENLRDLQTWRHTELLVCCPPHTVDYFEYMGYNVIPDSLLLLLSDMRFDIIIGNPPYTETSNVQGPDKGGCAKSIDNIFFEKAMSMSDHVHLIIRSKFFSKQSSKFRRMLFTTGHVASIKALPPDTFGISSMIETCCVDWYNRPKQDTEITYLNGTSKRVLLEGDTCIRLTNPDYVSCVENNMSHRYERGTLNLNQLSDGDNPMIITMGDRGSDMVVRYVDDECHKFGVGQHGVVMNSKYGGKGFGKVYVKPINYSVSGSAIILKTSSETESQKLAEYLSSDSIRRLATLNKVSNANTKELFATIPDLV